MPARESGVVWHTSVRRVAAIETTDPRLAVLVRSSGVGRAMRSHKEPLPVARILGGIDTQLHGRIGLAGRSTEVSH